MQDISHDKVPTTDTLYHLIDPLASWRVNQFQLYTEHTFAYRNHKGVWEELLERLSLAAIARVCGVSKRWSQSDVNAK